MREEIQARRELRAFARLILPIFEAEFQDQLLKKQPCWMFITILHRHMLELEQQAK